MNKTMRIGLSFILMAIFYCLLAIMLPSFNSDIVVGIVSVIFMIIGVLVFWHGGEK